MDYIFHGKLNNGSDIYASFDDLKAFTTDEKSKVSVKDSDGNALIVNRGIIRWDLFYYTFIGNLADGTYISTRSGNLDAFFSNDFEFPVTINNNILWVKKSEVIWNSVKTIPVHPM